MLYNNNHEKINIYITKMTEEYIKIVTNNVKVTKYT